MILGTGIDIVELTRMQSAYERWGERIARRILTESEIDILKERRGASNYLGSRFAAKEAFLKALGTGYSDGISWQDMEVVRLEGNRPALHIKGRAREILDNMGASTVHLSISHEKRYAVAQVILEG